MPNGKVIELELEGSAFEDWQLTVRLLNDTEPILEETLMCSYDPDAWVGGSDGLYLRPALAATFGTSSLPWKRTLGT